MAEQGGAGQGAVNWRPNARTLLTIKQLGISNSLLDETLEEYNNLSLLANDESFLLWLGHYLTSHDDKPPAETCLIPLDWRPGQQLLARLQGLGYSGFIIDFHIEPFVMEMREAGLIVKDWGNAYQDYLRRRCKKKTAGVEDAFLLQGFTQRQLDEWKQLYDTLPSLGKLSFESFCKGMVKA
jgi:hypothetical protein